MVCLSVSQLALNFEKVVDKGGVNHAIRNGCSTVQAAENVVEEIWSAIALSEIRHR